MSSRHRLPGNAVAVAVGLALALAGCGGSQEVASTTGTAPTAATTAAPAPETVSLRVYFLRDGRVASVSRAAPKTPALAAAALRALFAGPTEAGLTTEVPDGATWTGLTIADGVAKLDLPGTWSNAALAQAVYTLTQFPTVSAVELGGRRLTRADFEDETPIILVETPAPGDTVGSPLRVAGTANTFEATLQLELTGADGGVVAKQTVTATSGSGTRGTFDATVPFTVSQRGPGKLTAYEDSAEDGSRIHVYEVPVTLTP